MQEGELQLLDKMLRDTLSTDELYLLKLYKNDVTPTDSDTSASYTVADFTDYYSRSLTRASWNASVSNTTKAESSYGSTPESWTCGASGNTIFGYWVEGQASNKVLWAERFATQRVLASGDVLNITPKFTLTSEN